MAKAFKSRVIAPVISSAPGSPTAGEFYYDSTANVLYWYDGTTWVPARDSGIILYARLATQAALPANTRTSNTLTATANATLASIDGSTAAVNDYILVRNEATGANSGLYKVTSVGSAGTKWTMDRAVEMNTSAECVPGMEVVVSEGNSGADQTYQLTTDGPITLNTTALVFSKRPGDFSTWFGIPLISSVDLLLGANTAYYGQIIIPHRAPITGIAYFVGTATSGNIRCSLYDSTGARVANRSSAQAQTTANTFQKVAFDSVFSAPPGTYFSSLILDNATGKGYGGLGTTPWGTVAGPGSGATPTSITPPTTLSFSNIVWMTTY